MRIGVFGGTFDPPHVGHLILAADACGALRLDLLIFVPASAQPFKVDTPAVAGPEDRLEMVRLAVSGDALCTVEDTEIRRGGLSYTVDTLDEISAKHAGAELFLLIGQDTLAGFSKWKEPERIGQLATLAVMRRAGAARTEGRHRRRTVEISTRRVDISSTEIRERMAAGKSIRGFVPESVERFITERGLYIGEGKC